MCPGSREITSPRRLLAYQDTSDDTFINMEVNKLPGMKINEESGVIQHGSIKRKQSNKGHNPNNTKLTQTESSLSDEKIVFSKPRPPSTLSSNQICERKVMDKEKNMAKIGIPQKFVTKLDVSVSKSRKTETIETNTNKVKKAFRRLFDIFKAS